MAHADEAEAQELTSTRQTDQAARREGWLAFSAMSGGVLVTSCCVLPLALVLTGVSGAWIGNLTMLEPYKPYFLAVTAIVIGTGFWHVYFKPQVACAEGSYCARPSSAWLTKGALWIATLLALLSATITWWAPWFY